MNKTGTKRIETPRLILRPFVPEDAEAMYRNWASDPAVTEFLTWPPHASVEATRLLLADWCPRYAGGDYFEWAIELRELGEAVGSIAAVKLNESVGAAELGYCLGRAWWGRGLMSEALGAVLDYLFDEVGLQRVAACHDARNPRSGRVMEKAGMRLEGTWRQAGRNNRGVCDEVWHAMLRADREGKERL